MKSLLICVFCVVALALTGCERDSSNTSTTKTVSQLTETEKEALQSLTQQIYKDVGAQFYYTTTYYFLPSENGSTREKLDKPMVLLSGACVGSHMLDENTLAAIKSQMQSKVIGWKGEDGKGYKLSIVEGFLDQSPDGAGGSMYSSNDMVTIVPTKLQVTEE